MPPSMAPKVRSDRCWWRRWSNWVPTMSWCWTGLSSGLAGGVAGELGIRFCMRCDNDSSWSALTAFIRSGADQAWVTLKPPSVDDAAAWGCSRTPPRLRLVRQVSPACRAGAGNQPR